MTGAVELLSSFNANFSLAAILFGSILSLFLWIRYPKPDATLRAFRKFVLTTTISAALEVIANGTAYYSTTLPAGVVILFNMISGMGTAVCSYYLVVYVYSYVQDMHIVPRIINRLILVLSFVMQLLNLRFHFYFHVDESGHFVHDRFYVYGTYFISLYFIVFATIVLIIYRRSYQRRSFYYLMLSSIAVSAMILLQTTQTQDIMLTYFTAILGSFILVIL